MTDITDTTAAAAPDWRALLPSRRALERGALGLIAAAGIVVATDYGYDYWRVGRYLVTTDDAYVQADYTIVAPKVSGYIAEVLVRDNQAVKAGQVLARVDDRDFHAALEQAQAGVEAAAAAIRNLDARLVLQRSIIDQEKAAIAATKATLTFAQQDQTRYQHLRTTGYGSVQRAERASATLQEQTAQLRRNQAALAAARAKIDVLVSERGKAEAERDRSQAVLRQAKLNLAYTKILAPVAGTVGARSLRVGQYVQAGTQLMAVVPLDAVYVVANLKETQLAHVGAGQPVTIRVDGLPDMTFLGRVDSLSPASGLEFALLPPDNATGNFTKIVQRIPVKIVLEHSTPTGRLRAGMSVEPTIDTRLAVTTARRVEVN